MIIYVIITGDLAMLSMLTNHDSWVVDVVVAIQRANPFSLPLTKYLELISWLGLKV